MSEVTKILHAIEQGSSDASGQLLPLVYDELRKLAATRLSNESNSQSIHPTLLVHEAYVRLVDVENEPQWNSRGHFFGAAAEAMRRILIENARRRQSQKRGGDWKRIPLENFEPQAENVEVDLLDLDEALTQLEQQWPDQAQLVKLRYFAGLTIAEAAHAMGVSRATAERYWSFAKAWLFQRLKSNLP